MKPEFNPGQRVQSLLSPRKGTVLKHDGRSGGGGTRRILVEWDAVPGQLLPSRRYASSIQLKEIE
jgi:hypothetical protein